MKNFTLAASVMLLILSGCAASKKALEKSNAFNTAFAALENDNKNDAARLKAQEAYNAAAKKQLAFIAGPGSGAEEARLDGLAGAYSALQAMYETVANSACCSKLLTVTSYYKQLSDACEAAADHYYHKAENLVANSTTDGIRSALAAYQKTLAFVPDYKDAAAKAANLFSTNSFVVAFNPVEDSSFFAETVASSKFYTYSNDIFIKNLIRELNTSKSSIPFLLLLPYSDCLEKGITPDWLVDITMPVLEVPVHFGKKASYDYERKFVGVDTTGKPIYDYVPVPYYHSCDIIDNGQLKVNVDITDAGSGKTIAGKVFEATLGATKLSWCDGDRGSAISVVQFGKMTLQENAAMTLYANVYEEYKKDMKALFER
jgi:hypothetical protein